MVNLLGPFPVTRSGNKFVIVFHENNLLIDAYSCISVTADVVAGKIIGFLERHGTPVNMRLDQPEVFCRDIHARLAGRLYMGVLAPMTLPQEERSEQMCHYLINVIHSGIECAQNRWDELLGDYLVAVMQL